VIWAPERAAFDESPAFIGEAIALFSRHILAQGLSAEFGLLGIQFSSP
jgi:hypothetical protein